MVDVCLHQWSCDTLGVEWCDCYKCEYWLACEVKAKCVACEADLGLSVVKDKWACEALGLCLVKNKWV